jgi:hypothetical protein
MLKYLTIFAAVFTVLATQSISFAGLDDKSLVLYLSFDEGAGKEAKDGSIYGHNGELIQNPTWVDGRVGKALEFDGTKGQYVQVPITDTLQLTRTFSVAFWVKRGKGQIREWNYMVAAGPLKWAVIFRQGDDKTYVWSTSGGQWAQKAASNNPQPQDWTHIVVTHDTNSGVIIYNNGQAAGQGAKPPVVDAIDGSIMVGARHPGEEFFTGTIDEVFLFNRIITDAEIQQLMENLFLPVEPGGKLPVTWGSIKRSRQ